jgi:shikimate dehydrogenase
VRGVRAIGFKGFNCTIPHKVAVIEHLDGLGESAQLMGAVNCVVRRDGKLIGENTDGKGFVSSLSELCDPQGKSMVLVGAGGAARAISVEMALAGVERIVLVNRTLGRGRKLEQLLKGPVNQVVGGKLDVEFTPLEDEFSIAPGIDILVNATSIGLYPDVNARVPVAADSLRPDLVVADVIPNPPATHLVRTAREKGCQVIDGLGMLVAQGVIGIEYWTGQTPDATVMRKSLEDVLGC